MSKKQIHPRHLSSINKQLNIDKHISMDTPLQHLERKMQRNKRVDYLRSVKHINWSHHIAHLERGGGVQMLVNARARTSQGKIKVVNASLQTQQWCYSWASTARANYNINTMFTGLKKKDDFSHSAIHPMSPPPSIKAQRTTPPVLHYFSFQCMFVFPRYISM